MSESAGAAEGQHPPHPRRTRREAVADEVIEAYEARAAAVGGAVNAAAGDPTVSVVRFAALDTFRLYQRASFRVSSSTTPAWPGRPTSRPPIRPSSSREVSFEELAQADAGADVLFYTIFGNEDPADEQANGGRSAIEANPLWTALPTVQAATAHEMSDETWMSAVGLYGAQAILDDLAATFGVDPARDGA